MIAPVSGNLGSPGASTTAPQAIRLSRPGWRDPRLWVGVLIVVVSVVAGAQVLAAADDSVAVYAATRSMGAGDTITADDLVVQRVRFADTADVEHYLSPGADFPSEVVLSRGVGAGELLARSAVAQPGDDGLVQLPVPVDTHRVPPSVFAGSVVDVFLLPSDGGRCPAGCAPVLEGVTVVSASSADDGFGTTGQRQLVLGVTDDEARDFIAAHGTLDSPTVTVVRRG